jgi:prevent-host-death family protein
MSTTILTVSEVNQNFSRARKAVQTGPVVITDHGAPALVLMSYENFMAQKLTKPSLLERLDVPGTEDIPFEPGLLGSAAFRPADLG